MVDVAIFAITWFTFGFTYKGYKDWEDGAPFIVWFGTSINWPILKIFGE